MDRYKELKPRLPQDRYSYAILEQLVELNNNIKKLFAEENKTLEVPIEEEVQEVVKSAKKTRKKKVIENDV